MIILEDILSQEIVQRLGWTLLHFIWQAAVVALLLAILLRLLQKSTANLRYIFACLTLGLIVLLPVITIKLVPVSQPLTAANIEPALEPTVLPATEMPAPDTIVTAKPSRPENAVVIPEIPFKQRVVDTLEPALPYIVSGWLIGVFGLSIWNLGGWTQLQRLKRRMVKQVDSTLQNKLKVLTQKLKVTQTVRLMESALVQIPTVVGWLRPVILLPASALTGLSAEQLEAIVTHELAHIKRFDYLVNILQTIIETLGFYHPAVWWVSHKIRAERENCCDDMAVSISGDRVSYAGALASMEEIRVGRRKIAVAAGGGNLFRRICRLLGKDSANNTSLSWVPAVTVILLIIALAIPTTLALTNKSKSMLTEPQAELLVEDDIQIPSTDSEEAADAQIEVKKVLSAQKLKLLGLAVAMYADDNDENMPESIQELRPYIRDRQNFDWLRSNVVYFDKEKTPQLNAHFIPIAYDKTLLEKADGTNVLFLDFSVRFADTKELENLDIKRAEIIIDARFLAVSEDFFQSINLDANLPKEAKSTLRLTLEKLKSLDFSKRNNLILNDLDVILLLNAVHADKDSKVLANPQVLCREGKPAKIFIGKKIPILTGYTEPNNPYEKPKPKFDQIEKGISLSLTPNLTPNNNIYMKFEFEIITVTGFEEKTYKGKYPYKQPTVQSISQATQYTAKNGQTLLFGPHKIVDRQDGQTEQKDLLVLITARTVGSSEQDKPAQVKHPALLEPPGTTTKVITPPATAQSRTVKPDDSELKKTEPATVFSTPDKSVEPNEPMVTVNFNNVEMKFVIEKLAEWTGKIIIPTANSMSQKITTYGPKKVQKSQAVEMIYHALRLIGYTPEETDNVIFLKPISYVKGSEVPEISEDYPLSMVQNKDQVVQKFFKLKHYSPSRMAQIILPLVAEFGYVSADENTGSLLVIDTVKSLMRIEKIIEQYDVPKADETITEIFEIRNGDPVEIVELLKKLINGRPETGAIIEQRKELIVLIPEPRRKWIIAKASAENIKQIGQWIERLDTDKTTMGLDPIDAAVYEQLEMIVDLSDLAPGMSFGEVVEKLENSVEPPLQIQPIWKDLLENAEVEQATPAGMDPLTGIKLRKALEILLTSVSSTGLPKLTYVVDQGVILIGTAGMLPPKMGSHVYDTSDLLGTDTTKASPENMLKIAEQIEERDVPLDVDKVKPRIIELQNSDAEQMVELLKTLFTKEGGGALNIQDILINRGIKVKQKIVGPPYKQLTFEVVPGTKKLIIISKIPEAYDVIEEFIFDLDRQNVSPENIKQIVQSRDMLDTEKTIGLDPIDKAVYEQLETIVDLSDLAPEISFSEVIEKLENSIEPPLQIQPIWKNLLENAEVEQATPAGMDPLPHIKLRKALEILLTSVSSTGLPKLTYVVDEGVILIGTAGMLPAKMLQPVYKPSGLIETATEPAQPSYKKQEKTTPAIKPDEMQILRQQYINNDSRVKSLAEKITETEAELIELRQKLTPAHPQVQQKASLLRALKKALQERKKEVGESFDDEMTKEIHKTNQEAINNLLDEVRKSQERQQPLQQAQEKIAKLLDESEELMTPLQQIQKQLDELLKQQQEALKIMEPNLPPAQKVKFINNTFIDYPLIDALQYIAEGGNVTIIPDETVSGTVTCTLKDATVETSLDIVLGGTPYIWKKTPYYYLVVSGAGPFESTARLVSAKKLSDLSKALLIYANDYDDKYPNSLRQLPEYLNVEDYRWVLANVEYLASGKKITIPPDKVIAYDKKLLEKGKGTNVLYNDCHVGFVKTQELKQLGISESEITIETQLWSVTDDFLKDVGLDANFKNFSDDWKGHLAATYPAVQNGKPYGLIIDDLHVNFLLKALSAHKDANVLSSPQVLCREGRTAEINIFTEEYRYITGYNEPNSPSEQPQPKREKVDIGTHIWLTPNLTENNRNIKVDLKLEHTQLKGIIEGKYKGKYPTYKPIVEVISTNITCTIPAGKSMLIGGLKINEYIIKKPDTPRLGDLPLGAVFGSKNKTQDQKMLLILVKPVTNPK